MNKYSFLLLVGFVGHVFGVPAQSVVSITVEHIAAHNIYPRAVTEPAWVTELLGPTLYPAPVMTTTKRPNIPQRIRETIKQVHTTINGIPTRINQIFENLIFDPIQKGAQNIITGPGGPRTTIQPASGSPKVSYWF